MPRINQYDTVASVTCGQLSGVVVGHFFDLDSNLYYVMQLKDGTFFTSKGGDLAVIQKTEDTIPKGKRVTFVTSKTG